MQASQYLRSNPFLTALLILAGACTGCADSLSGSSWSVVEISGKTDADQATLEGVESIHVEFRTDGQLRTTIKRKDGNVDREEDETYKFSGDTIVIRHPDYERQVKFALTGETMQVSSDKFEAKLERFHRPAAEQPAMFRPADVGRVEYRSISAPRAGGARR